VCRWVSAIAAVGALAFASAALAGNPVAALYSDFVADGVLGCHSKADLHAVLDDATLQQYGDPSTMVGLKLAAHKQLAGGCRRSTQSSSASGTSQSSPRREQNQQNKAEKGSKKAHPERLRTTSQPPPTQAASTGGSTDERMLLGTGLLLLTLATGGWAARRAFNSKR
jgi:hypothetical protein